MALPDAGACTLLEEEEQLGKCVLHPPARARRCGTSFGHPTDWSLSVALAAVVLPPRARVVVPTDEKMYLARIHDRREPESPGENE